jgi:hypothetical protein
MTNFYDSLGINGGLNISANTTTDAIYISQLGTGNAVLIEDSSNPDSTPFIINSGGSVNIGRIEYLTTSGGTQAKLQVNNSTSQIPSSGLPFTTNFIVQGFNNNNVGLFTTDTNTSQIYFGTPSSVYGAKMSWYYTGGTFDISTETTGGTLTFGTDVGFERMRIQSDGKIGIGTTAATANLEVAGSISATTISGVTFYGDGSNLTGISGGGGTCSGGTVTNPTNFTGGLSANTFSATTYQNLPTVIQVSCSDEITALITGTTTTFRMPYNMLITEVRGSLTTAQTSGNTFTVDILRTGTTILSTLITINSNQKTSKAIGTTQPVISTPNLVDDDEMSVKITQIGSGTARGLKVAIIGNRTS